MSERQFRKGDTAILGWSQAYPQLVGMECVLLSDLEEFYVDGIGFCRVYLVEIPCAPVRGLPARWDCYDGWIVHPAQLRALPAGRQPARWQDGVWQPQKGAHGHA